MLTSWWLSQAVESKSQVQTRSLPNTCWIHKVLKNPQNLVLESRLVHILQDQVLVDATTALFKNSYCSSNNIKIKEFNTNIHLYTRIILYCNIKINVAKFLFKHYMSWIKVCLDDCYLVDLLCFIYCIWSIYYTEWLFIMSLGFTFVKTTYTQTIFNS